MIVTDPLAEFNRQEWADQPFTIQLRGGRADGQRFTTRTLPRMWRAPDVPPLSLVIPPDPEVIPTAESLTITYWPTGEVTDDGCHIFEAR